MEGRLGAGVVFPPPEGEEGAELITQDDDGNEVFVMEKVLARRRVGGGFQYLVKWVGYDDPLSNTWQSRKDAATTAAARAFDNFDLSQPEEPSRALKRREWLVVRSAEHAPRGKHGKLVQGHGAVADMGSRGEGSAVTLAATGSARKKPTRRGARGD